ncbi:Peptidyl-prolyl cis-trans isomerase [Diplonema papillatum]|nr:Peptidyl-prolyl cis-trans isomerase [Diplonema papillatum]
MTTKVQLAVSPERGSEVGEVIIEVVSAWSPLGAERFLAMVKDGLYEGCKVHRVVPKFIVQFGIAADPLKQAKWQYTIKDDPPKESNKRGTISFARRGDDTRSTQVFINLGDNVDLDGQGFTPFGRVTKGLELIERSYAGYASNKPDPTRIKAEGNTYLEKDFPNLGTIHRSTIV